jgi:hypothetical protein
MHSRVECKLIRAFFRAKSSGGALAAFGADSAINEIISSGCLLAGKAL